MSPVRYIAYIVCAIFFVIGVFMLTQDNSLGLLVFFGCALISHIGRPTRQKKPFWTGSRKEWASVFMFFLLMVAIVVFASWASPQLHPKRHDVLGTFEAVAILTVMLLFLGVQAFIERKKCLNRVPVTE
jgi:cadmium resistance protein CadD (predicted permease)